MSTSESGSELSRMASIEEEVFDGFESPHQLRLLLIGKTGNGKSTVGNIILGEQHFKVGFSMTSTTVKAARGEVQMEGSTVKVYDTPDISNMEQLDDDKAQREVGKWKAMTTPDPHAILLAVRCDVRYTREEHQIFLHLKRLWGGQPLCRRLVVVFTFGDRQDRAIDEELKEVCPELQSVLRDASQRYVVFNDRDTETGKTEQVRRLLDMVRQLDADLALSEERRLLSGVQVCPMGPVPTTPPAASHLRHPLRRTSSSESQRSRGSSSTDGDCLKLLLVGRPLAGKSSTGNTILGRHEFPVNHKKAATPHESMSKEVEVDGRTVQVIDTPGWQSAAEGEGGEPDRWRYERERRRASEMCSPGPHALLFVVRHRLVMEEDLVVYRTLRETLGQGLSHHTILVLVGMSRELATSWPQQLSTEDLKAQGSVFPTLLQEAGNKLWAVNNLEVEKQEEMQRQTSTLMTLVKGILDNSGGNRFRGDKAILDSAERQRNRQLNRWSCGIL